MKKSVGYFFFYRKYSKLHWNKHYNSYIPKDSRQLGHLATLWATLPLDGPLGLSETFGFN